MKVLFGAAVTALALTAGAPGVFHEVSVDSSVPAGGDTALFWNATTPAATEPADGRDTDRQDGDRQEPEDPSPAGTVGQSRAEDASAAGTDHAAAMRAWTRCVNAAARAASGPKSSPGRRPRAKDACAPKPAAPGRAGGRSQQSGAPDAARKDPSRAQDAPGQRHSGSGGSASTSRPRGHGRAHSQEQGRRHGGTRGPRG